MPRPLLTIACSLAGGIALFVITGSALPVFLVAAGLAVVLLLWPGLRDRRLSVILVVVPLLLGPFVATLRTPVAPGALPASVHIEGQISQVDAYDEYTRVRVSVTAWQGKKIPALARPLVDIWVQGKPPQGTVRYALVDWRGDLSAPEGPTNPGEFNFAAYLARLGVVAQSDGPGKLQVLRPAQGLTPLVASTLEQIRASLRTRWQTYLPPDEAGLVESLLIGDRGDLSDRAGAAWERAGLAHVLSVSGQHVGLIALMCLWLSSRWLKHPYAEITAIVGILAYSILVGVLAAAWRAAIMYIVMLVGRAIYRENDSLNALGFSAVLLLVYRPLWLFDAGFQLSYAATLSILILSPVFTPLFSRRLSVVPVSLAAQLGVLPLGVYYFNAIAPLALVSNIVVLPLIPLVMVAGLLAGLPMIGPVMGRLVGLPISLVNVIVARLSAIPGMSWNVAATSAGWVFLFYGALAGVIWLPKARWKVLSGILAAGMFLLQLFTPALPFYFGRIEVTFLSVGQGDAALVRMPAGAVLIDAGATSDSAAQVIVPFLKARGINRLNAVFISHPDADHASALPGILADFTVARVYTGPGVVMDELADSRVKQVPIATPGTLGFGRVVFQVLNPSAGDTIPGTEAEAGENDRSVVMELNYGQFSTLFMGDAGRAVDLSLLQAGDLHRITVLKVAHHGARSATSEELLDAVLPVLSVISVGEGNRYGHPHGETLSRLTASQTRILRTDKSGAVTIMSDGRRFKVTTFLP